MLPMHPSGRLSLYTSLFPVHMVVLNRARSIQQKHVTRIQSLSLSRSLSFVLVNVVCLGFRWQQGGGGEGIQSQVGTRTEKGKQISSTKIKFVLFSLSFSFCHLLPVLFFSFSFLNHHKETSFAIFSSKQNSLVAVFKFLRILPLRRSVIFVNTSSSSYPSTLTNILFQIQISFLNFCQRNLSTKYPNLSRNKPVDSLLSKTTSIGTAVREVAKDISRYTGAGFSRVQITNLKLIISKQLDRVEPTNNPTVYSSHKVSRER